MSTDLGQIGGNTYRIGSRLSAERQFHVARRLTKALAPAGEQLVSLLPKVAKALNPPTGDQKVEASPVEAAMILRPLMEAIGNMTDEDSEYVLHWCLSIVQRKSSMGDTWTTVWDPTAGYRFSDLDLPSMMTIAGKVLQDQLSSFFPGGLSQFRLQTRET